MPSNAPSTDTRLPVIDAGALQWGYRLVWGLCVAVYLTVFVGGLQGGGSDLSSMGRAVGLTLAMAVIGRLALAVLAQASLPAPEVGVGERPLATQDGTVGSLIDLTSSPNMSDQEDKAEAA